jgi:hypothetical protein
MDRLFVDMMGRSGHEVGSQRFFIFSRCSSFLRLKVPKCEIFDRSDFPDFYTINSSWVGDLVVKILTHYFNF